MELYHHCLSGCNNMAVWLTLKCIAFQLWYRYGGDCLRLIKLKQRLPICAQRRNRSIRLVGFVPAKVRPNDCGVSELSLFSIKTVGLSTTVFVFVASFWLFLEFVVLYAFPQKVPVLRTEHAFAPQNDFTFAVDHEMSWVGFDILLYLPYFEREISILMGIADLLVWLA